MNRIFYIHSNIVAISCYKTVKDALSQNDKVIIVLDRGCEWPYTFNNVNVYDFADLFEGDNRNRVALNNIKAFEDYLRFLRYKIHLNRVVNKIVEGQDFVFYLPTMALDMTAAFAYNKHCKGYYYVEEGTISYRSLDMVVWQYPSRIKNMVKHLLRIDEHFPFEISHLFKGTISVTSEAFPWNKTGERIVNPIDGCVSDLKTSIPLCDDVLVTTWLVEDIELIINSIDYTIKSILNKNKDSRIGIKFHPKATTVNRYKVLMTIEYLNNEYDGRVTIIPNDVSIELMSLLYHPRLYSLLLLSSLILYGLLLKSSEGYLIDNDDNTISITQITTVEEYLRLCRIVNYKRL